MYFDVNCTDLIQDKEKTGGSSERRNESSGSVKDKEFIDPLNAINLQKGC